jgi:1,2-phenylacetyl-CoA epoxidase catalytic subunit
MPLHELDEESKSLLRRIVERQAYRQMMIEKIRGHGLKFVPEIDAQILLAQDIVHSLQLMQQIELVYSQLGGNDLVTATRDKMERIPYPASRLELSICLALCDRAERVAAESYVDSRSSEFAQIALSILAMDRTSTRQAEELFKGFCSESGNHHAAQQMFQRWLAITIQAMGRPGTQGDVRAAALGLRKQRCGDSLRQYLEELKPLIASCGLQMPSAAAMGVELPKELAGLAGG